jgi:predicted TPR repeat methyltransferase
LLFGGKQKKMLRAMFRFALSTRSRSFGSSASPTAIPTSLAALWAARANTFDDSLIGRLTASVAHSAFTGVELRPGSKVLDLNCATGDTSLALFVARQDIEVCFVRYLANS